MEIKSLLQSVKQMKNKICFLCSFPNSGFDYLTNTLKQNNVFFLSKNVNFFNFLGNLVESTEQKNSLSFVFDHSLNCFFEKSDNQIVIDFNNMWHSVEVLKSLRMFFDHDPKIIFLVRSVADCAASMFLSQKEQNLDEFFYYNRVEEKFKNIYQSSLISYKNNPSDFCFIDYDDLKSNPKEQLNKIHKFLDLPNFNYNFNHLDTDKINENSKNILKHYYEVFSHPEFWSETPKTKHKIHDLDFQLSLSKVGNFDAGWELVKKIEKEDPNNHRAAYNRGWYYLRQGKIQEGYRLLDRGRIARVFGNDVPNTRAPFWDGKSSGIILLYLEGGFGDQIHQVRYAKLISEKNCKVIVSCSKQLMNLFSEVDGVSAVVSHDAVTEVCHDFLVQGMSAVVPLGLELHNLSGDPYINRPVVQKMPKKRIGLRWQGQILYEDEHNKKFPYDFLFDAVKDFDFDFVSLQRDYGEEFCPEWVNKVKLETWEDTRDAVASCDLVISSCTSVSHLSSAMGVETWVIVPILPYFLYAMDGDRCPYYNSMRLFRQKKFGEWIDPFLEVKENLSKL